MRKLSEILLSITQGLIARRNDNMAGNETQRQGKIEKSQKSQSGKTASVQVDGIKYSCKDFSILNLSAGTVLDFSTSDSEYNNQVVHWINKYVVIQNAPPCSTAVNRTKVARFITAG